MISELPGSLFFFCFNIECQLVRLWMTCALVWSCMNQWLLFSTIHTYFSQTHLIAQLGGVPGRDWISQALMQQSPLSRRRLFGGADAGAEPWYKTIAKLMQGRNRTSTHTCEPRAGALRRFRLQTNSSYLVDPASSHMLVLKIKPCMSKYKHLYRETANGSLKQLWFI